uniref:Uncharacterized protein n=1 Tax=Neogobius melanostomus TaxID=47308 RepID=A0A8C6UKC8_9GOBI
GPCSLGDALAEEEKEFQKVLAQIGGREKIHLVSDVGKSKEDDDAGILPKAVANPSEDGGKETRNDSCQKTVTRRTNISSTKRTIDSPIIVFLFRQTFISCQGNLLYLKEILRDVKARTKRAKVAQPALIGLIRTTLESAETDSKTLQTKAAFIKWGLLINWQRGKHVLIVSFKDNTRHRRNSILWPFQCLFGTNGRTPRNQANSSSSGHRQTGRSISTGPKGTHLLNRSFLTGLHQFLLCTEIKCMLCFVFLPGNHKDREAGIPLKTNIQSAVAHVDEESSGKDG